MSTIPQAQSLKTPTISAVNSPAASPSPTVPLSEKERPVVIIIQDNPIFALDIVRALRDSPDIRACLLTDLSNGLLRVDVWKRGEA